MNNVKQEFDVLTNAHHVNHPVLLRVKQGDKEFWTDKYQARIWGIRESGKIALTLGDNAMLEVTREMIKLKG